jgi:la-related protein 1
MRGRGLPDEGTGVAEPRYGHQRRSSYHRASPGTSDQSGYQSAPYANGSITPLSESSYYRRAPGPPLLDMVRHPPRYAQNFIPPYALLPQYPAGHIPGHTSPPYLATGHHSGPSTPPYPHYPPYPVYMFGHPPILWGDILPPAQPNPYFPDHPDISHNHINSSEPLVPQMEFGTQAPMSPVITTEPSASNAQAIELENGQLLGNVEQLSPPLEQAKPPRVVFGTFDVTESGDESSNLPLLTGDDGERRQERTDDVEHAIEQFTAFSIGVGPDEPAPLRHASRKASVRSLSKLQISPPTVPATNGSALVQNSNSSDVTLQSNHESNSALPQQAEGSGIMKPVKWEFGTTLRDDLDDEPRPLSPSPPPSHSDPQNHFNDISVESSSSLAEDPTRKEVSDQLVTVDFLGSASANNDPAVAASLDISPADHSMEKSEEGSISSDVWVVKDYGYGFGDMSGCGNAPDVVQWEMKQRERARIRENYREREMILEQCQRDRERGWVHPGRQLGWRHENGVEDEREVLEQHVDAPRGHMRPRRGSHPGPYVGYGRGGHTGRRGRGFGGGYHVGRHSGGRGGLHHRRPASLPYNPSPFEVIPPPVDIPNGYGHPLHIPSYTPPELDPYQVVPPPPVPAVPVPTPTFPYPMDATRTHLLEQLEYYLSSQNLAQDFFLRQRVSCRFYSGSRTG